MKIIILTGVLILSHASAVFGDILSVQDAEDSYVVATTGSKILHVPKNSINRHYNEVLNWVSKGGVIIPLKPWVNNLTESKSKRKKELEFEGKNLFKNAVLNLEYSSSQVNIFKDCLRSNLSNFRIEINLLTSISEVKNYIVTWCDP